MSLGKLLAAGRCLAWRWSDQSRYRVDKRVYLPKFESPKNPFKVREQTGPPVATVGMAVPVGGPGPAGTQKLPLVPDSSKPAGRPIGKAVVPVRPAPRSAGWPVWLARLNPFAVRPAQAVSLVRQAKAPAQAELSLDTVKVLRNDLSDTDVEIVPLKSRSPRETPAAGSAGRPNWAFLGEGLVKLESP